MKPERKSGNDGDGIRVDGSQDTTVGADNSAGLTGNVVSGNGGNGISVDGNQNTGTQLSLATWLASSIAPVLFREIRQWPEWVGY